jgi:5-methylthioadenosine/S-adenosylhomocysteine deaminase
LRSILSFEATERVSQENGWKGVEENLNFIKERNDKEDSLVRGMFCTHTTFTCKADFLKKVRDLADRYPAGVHFHLEEGAYESDYCAHKYDKLPVEFYEEIGFLGRDVLASQCVQTKPKETEILKRHGVKISHMPISNCEVGGGIAPVPSYLEKGLTVGLGTDGYIQDMFEVMRAAFLIHKGYLQNASVMPADTVIRMATIDGARSIGLEKSVGSIAAGKKADLITVDLKAPTPVTPENLPSHLVVFGDGSLAKDSIVNGRLVMKNRKILTADENDIRKKCIDAANDLWKA